MVDGGSPARCAWWLLVLAVAGCAPARRAVAPAIIEPNGDGLRVTLVWQDAVDLDLYVTMPDGETIYYANPRQAFVRDARCDAGEAGGREEARWRRPAAGRYRIGVDFPEACDGGATAAAYRIVIDVDGRREERTGTAHVLVREPAVLETVVP